VRGQIGHRLGVGTRAFVLMRALKLATDIEGDIAATRLPESDLAARMPSDSALLLSALTDDSEKSAASGTGFA